LLLATVASWSTPFVGTASEAFVETLDGYMTDKVDLYYARFISIVQSSGMGKSRMIDEVAKTKFVLPLNLRKNSDGQIVICSWRHLLLTSRGDRLSARR
jgi:hypothetical protein